MVKKKKVVTADKADEKQEHTVKCNHEEEMLSEPAGKLLKKRTLKAKTGRNASALLDVQKAVIATKGKKKKRVVKRKRVELKVHSEPKSKESMIKDERGKSDGVKKRKQSRIRSESDRSCPLVNKRVKTFLEDKVGKRVVSKSGSRRPRSSHVEQQESSDDLVARGGGENLTKPKKHVVDNLNPLKVFIGNIPWSASEEGVHMHFAQCGDIERFDMPLNDQGRPSGNAYVYYKMEGAVAKALEYDGIDYQGRPLKVKRAVRQNKDGHGDQGQDSKGHGKDGQTRESNSRPSNNDRTVFVGGLCYDVEYETLRRDFEECGEIEAIRMVKNEDGAFKGIAFVVFQAETGVVEALKYDGDEYQGRKLVVRRAGDNGKGGKGKKGNDDKGKGNGKAGLSKGKGKGVCFKFKEGKCPFGDKCIFSHE